MAGTERSRVLGDAEIRQGIAEASLAWTLEGDALAKQVKGKDFAAALDYVNRVGELAESLNHHPDIAISWNTVSLRLRSHSAGGITPMDLEAASRIDQLEPPRA